MCEIMSASWCSGKRGDHQIYRCYWIEKCSDPKNIQWVMAHRIASIAPHVGNDLDVATYMAQRSWRLKDERLAQGSFDLTLSIVDDLEQNLRPGFESRSLPQFLYARN